MKTIATILFVLSCLFAAGCGAEEEYCEDNIAYYNEPSHFGLTPRDCSALNAVCVVHQGTADCVKPSGESITSVRSTPPR